MVTTFSADKISYALNPSTSFVGADADADFLFYNIEFLFRSEDIVCLLGKNGAGKTSLLKICAGLLNPSFGNIFLNQKNLADISLQDKVSWIAWLSQGLLRPENFKVTDFLSLPYNSSIDYVAVLEDFQLKSIEKKELSVLSGGEWRWLQLARIWSRKARVVFLDEPESDLDLEHKFSLVEKCKTYAKENNAIIIITTHDIHFAYAVSNKICALNQKQLVWNSDAKDFWDSQALFKLFGIKNFHFWKNMLQRNS